MTIEEFYKLLERHDWFFEYSDDYSVWQKGSAQRGELKQLAKSNDDFAIMYQEYTQYINAIITDGPNQDLVQRPVLEDYL